jgi:phospholipid-binding lipoprotein MlaA
MKITLFPVLLLIFFAVGCAHSPAPALSPTQPVPQTQRRQLTTPPPNSAAIPAQRVEPVAPPADPAGDSPVTAVSHSGDSSADIAGDYQEPDDLPTSGVYQDADSSEKGAPPKKSEQLTIADPLEPFNRAMFQFNDKLYFWVLKPVALAYKKVVHEDFRVVVKNFFSNAAFPVRFLNCLLQANLKGAASEAGRFALNTLIGFGGIIDVASDPEINLAKHDEDLGQTLGAYGIGQGFYINWPLFGPSSPRDTVGMAGDGFLSPFYYLEPWYATAGVRGYDMINETSFRIGDYEALKKAALDPYVAVRDAYVQYRFNKVKRRDGAYSLPGAGTVRP